MRILPFLVLLSALAIAGCAAYFSIVGLKLLFVGGGVSIIVMGVALEVGKLITATFLKQKWNEISGWLKFYMTTATLVLVLITSIGIYGYLSAGYNATSTAVQGYERVIQTNEMKIAELEKEIVLLKDDKLNESEVTAAEANRKLFIEQRMQLVAQKNQQIEKIRSTANDSSDSTNDLVAAKQALELTKQALDGDTAREQEQIKLYNSRLEILDKEVQKWLDEGRGNVFRKGGLDRAREVKESQKNERDAIDSQIKQSQDRIEKLREQYAAQVQRYNERVAAIEARSNSQRSLVDENVKTVQKEIGEIMQSIDSYNKETDEKIAALNNRKGELAATNKQKIEDALTNIKNLHTENDELRQNIIRTDVGTFRFIADSLNLELNDAVNYFIWTIMFVFDPLAVCLILAYNTMVKSKKDEEEPVAAPEPKVKPVEPIITPEASPEVKVIASEPEVPEAQAEQKVVEEPVVEQKQDAPVEPTPSSEKVNSEIPRSRRVGFLNLKVRPD